MFNNIGIKESARMGDLGVRIEESLRKSGMQQRQLASRIGISDSALSRYISGERKPNPNVLANIATALGVTSDYLLGIEPIKINGEYIKRLIARGGKDLSREEKRELISIILGDEI